MNKLSKTKPVALYYDTHTNYLDTFDEVRVRMTLAVVAIRHKDDPEPDWQLGHILNFNGKSYIIEEVQNLGVHPVTKRVRIRRKDGRYKKSGARWKNVPTDKVTWRANIIGIEHASITV